MLTADKNMYKCYWINNQSRGSALTKTVYLSSEERLGQHGVSGWDGCWAVGVISGVEY